MTAAKEKAIGKRKLVGQVGELAHGASKKFTIRSGDRELEALLVNYEGRFFAYRNRCPHVGITLDWVDNQFFSVDGRYLMCANHGAVFEPKNRRLYLGPVRRSSAPECVIGNRRRENLCQMLRCRGLNRT